MGRLRVGLLRVGQLRVGSILDSGVEGQCRVKMLRVGSFLERRFVEGQFKVRTTKREGGEHFGEEVY